MARQLKVYGSRGFIAHTLRRAIIAATSKAEVRRITGMSRSELDNYWTETGNEKELAAALAKPGTLLIEREWGEFVTKDEWHL